MSGASWKHYYEPIASTSLTYDRPVDTFAARTAIDNVAHLVDSAPVYRVNWVDPLGFPSLPYFMGATNQAQYLTIAQEFPTTLMREGRYLGFDVRVAAGVTGGITAYVTAAITTPDVAYPINDPTAPGVLGFAGAFVSTLAPSWIIDTQFTGEAPVKRAYMVCTNTGDFATGATASSEVGHLRLVIAALGFWDNTSFGESVRIYGIQVREYTIE